MAKINKKNIKKVAIFDFTDIYRKKFELEERDKAEALDYTLNNKDEAPIKKLSLWQRIKNLFKKNK